MVNKAIWIPPGGGLHFGESIFEAAQRECFEETGVQVQSSELYYVTELIQPTSLHALEYYVKCEWLYGEPALGVDPELKSQQILLDVDYIPLKRLSMMEDVHPFFLRKQFLTDLANFSSFPQFIPSSSYQGITF